MKMVFCGSGDFAVPTLDALAGSGHEILSVFTQPDREAGRGRKIHFTPVKTRALEMNLPIFQPVKLRRNSEPPELLKELGAEVAVVVAYGHLIPKTMLDVPRHGFVNLHASLLPRWRGAAPVPHAILNGDERTGVTVFRLNEKFDEGDVLDREIIDILPADTSATVLEKLSSIGANLMLKVIGEIEAGWTHAVPQMEEEATLAPKFEKSAGLIDWAESCHKIDCLTRAFQPWPLAYTFLPGKDQATRICVLKVAPAAAPTKARAPGTVLHVDDKTGIVVQCGDGAVSLELVKPEGKRQMRSADYARGARLQAGIVLGNG
jgi:methionyl-tRNA formyltransferase